MEINKNIFIDKKIICGACKDNSRCKICGFGKVQNRGESPFAFKDKKIGFKDPAE